MVIERFTRRAQPQFVFNHLCKAFVRVSAWEGFWNAHAPKLCDGQYVNTRGEPVTWQKADYYGLTTTLAWDKLRIDHFQVKSRVECERKKIRGCAYEADRDFDRYFEENDRNDLEDPVPEILIERIRQEMVRIMMKPTTTQLMRPSHGGKANCNQP